jgi:SAM-dependent methyltransferase
MSAVAMSMSELFLDRVSDDTDSDGDSDKYSDISMDSFRPTDASSMTTASMRSPSPTQSVFSVTSSLRAQSFRYEHGRGVNNYSEVYRLPADDDEIRRLDAQHEMFKMAMGKYPPPLAEVMADDVPGETKAILDLGCGSGSWIMEAARDFPNCSAVAVDLVPMQSLYMPSNCRSEVDDINLGLEHFYGDFNVVHARLICTGIKDYAALVDQIGNVLRPRGLVEFIEYGFRLYDENKQVINVSTSTMEAPWLPRWLAWAYMAVIRRGGTLDAADRLYDWVKDNPMFEDVVHKQYWLPSSPWFQGDDPETTRLNELAELVREDTMVFISYSFQFY